MAGGGIRFRSPSFLIPFITPTQPTFNIKKMDKKVLKILNLIEKPKWCQYEDCKNKPYAKDYFLPNSYVWVCRKHNLVCNYGIDEYSASQITQGKMRLNQI